MLLRGGIEGGARSGKWGDAGMGDSNRMLLLTNYERRRTHSQERALSGG